MKLKQGVYFVTLCVALAGCGDKGKDENKATQVAAKVGADEVTVHQINHELAKLGNVPAAQARQAANRVLNALVDQQLFMQKAMEQKLDRNPNVVQAIESARRQILAQSYLEKLTAAVPKPGDTEIKAFYDQHPELFAQRRIYQLQELQVQAGADKTEAVKAKLAAVRNLGEFVDWLKAENIPAKGGQSVKAAEALPLELLSRLRNLKDGQVLSVSTPGGYNILHLVGSRVEPLAEAQARPLVEQYLMNSKRREIAQQELKKLRDATELKYFGDYTDAAKVPTAAATAPVAPSPGQDAMEKGLKGL